MTARPDAYLETWGFDLRTAEGYQAWRDAGGRWPDETPERMRAWRRARDMYGAVELRGGSSDDEAA